MRTDALFEDVWFIDYSLGALLTFVRLVSSGNVFLPLSNMQNKKDTLRGGVSSDRAPTRCQKIPWKENLIVPIPK